MSWLPTGALNDRLDWVANALRLTCVDPNSSMEDRYFAGDLLHLNGKGKKGPGQIYVSVSGLDVGGSAESKV